jgi:hypothetical protein
MNKLREVAYRVDPALWVRQVIGVGCVPPLKPMAWQEQFLRAHAAPPFWH